MENKPKIFGFCPAGCKWETIHRSEFENLASCIDVLPHYVDSTYKRWDLEPFKKYKVTFSTRTAVNCYLILGCDTYNNVGQKVGGYQIAYLTDDVYTDREYIGHFTFNFLAWDAVQEFAGTGTAAYATGFYYPVCVVEINGVETKRTITLPKIKAADKDEALQILNNDLKDTTLHFDVSSPNASQWNIKVLNEGIETQISSLVPVICEEASAQPLDLNPNRLFYYAYSTTGFNIRGTTSEFPRGYVGFIHLETDGAALGVSFIADIEATSINGTALSDLGKNVNNEYIMIMRGAKEAFDWYYLGSN